MNAPLARITAALPAAIALLAACGGTAGAPRLADPRPFDACAAGPVAIGDAVEVRTTCNDTALRFVPAIAFAPRTAFEAGTNCRTEGDNLVCDGPGGTLTAVVSRAARTVVVRYSATAPPAAAVNGLALLGTGGVAGATGRISNGFQSWSSSGVIALGRAPSDRELQDALRVQGDGETQRPGDRFSWWFTGVGGGPGAFVAGVARVRRFAAWAGVYGGADALTVRLVSGGIDDAVPVSPGAVVDGEPWFTAAGADATALLADYGDALETRRTAVRAAADAGWNSWYELFDNVTAEAVTANAAAARAILRPRVADRPLRIVIDDGWQRAWGDWDTNAKFPAGLAGTAQALKDQGFETGIWLAPFLAARSSAVFAAHPDWFMPDTGWNHLSNGPMAILDVTNLEAAAHLGETIRRIVEAGFDMLKIDFLFAGTFTGTRREAITGMEAYRRGLEIIRRAAGERTVILAVGAPGQPSLPFVDAWRVGADICYPEGPAWPFVATQARNTATRWPLCRATLCDADPVLLRGMERAQVDAGGWIVALAGGALFLSDDLTHLAPERAGWGLPGAAAALSVGGIAAAPLDYFVSDPPATLPSVLSDLILQRNTHRVPALWALPDGRRLVWNVGDTAVEHAGAAVGPRSAAVLP